LKFGPALRRPASRLHACYTASAVVAIRATTHAEAQHKALKIPAIKEVSQRGCAQR